MGVQSDDLRSIKTSSSSLKVLFHKCGLDDTRRLVHSFKVGLALTLASLLVLLKNPYTWIGQNAIWAVITVVVVFETSAGATLGKGLNRGIGTVLAGLLALGAAHLADLLQEIGEPIFIGTMVFIAGTACTYARAIPKVKKKFDYGVVIFMLTFCMVLVTGYRVGDEVTTASDRLLTIMIGGLICLLVSSLIIPHWAGEDLHMLAADNFDKLGNALEDCVKEYLSGEAQSITSKMIVDRSDVDPMYKACWDAVKSRSTEEALVVFASWEPPHGHFRLGYPWKEYLTVGAALRHYAYSVLALHGCLRSEIQAPGALRMLFANELLRASQDGADLLRELGGCIRNLRKPRGSPRELLHNVNRATDAIKKSISKHSYLLASPESWTALEDHLRDKRERLNAVSRPEASKNISSIATRPKTVPAVKKMSSCKKISFNQIHPLAAEGALHQFHSPTELSKPNVNNNDRDRPLQAAKSDQKQESSQSVHAIEANTDPTAAYHHDTVWDYSESSFDHRKETRSSAGEGHLMGNNIRHQGNSQPGPFCQGGLEAKDTRVAESNNELPKRVQTDSVTQNKNLQTQKSSKISNNPVKKDFHREDIKKSAEDDIASALSLVTFASLLVEGLARLDKVVEAVHRLSELGGFKPTPNFNTVEAARDKSENHMSGRDLSLDSVTMRALLTHNSKLAERHLPSGFQLSTE